MPHSAKRHDPTPLHPDLAPKVLQVLANYINIADLHTKLDDHAGSIVTGQAVASAVSQVTGDGRAIAFNDVDVFHFASNIKSRPGSVTYGVNHEVADIEFTSHGSMHLSSRSVFRLKRSRRRALLNECFCSFEDVSGSEADLHNFLRTFDLNCVQVGIDLGSKRLIWTQAFEQFRRTGQMEVCNVATPLHTAVRWFAKREQLEGVYGHDESTMALLAAAVQRSRRVLAEGERHHCMRSMRDARGSLRFGTAMAGKARALSSRLGPWFSLWQADSPNPEVPLFTMSPRGEVDPRLFEPSLPTACLPDYARALHGRYKRRHAKLYIEACNALIERDGDGQHTNKAWPLGMRAVVEGIDYAQMVRDEATARRLKREIAEHRSLAGFVGLMDTARLVAVVDAMAGLAGARGRMVYGILDNFTREQAVELAFARVQDVAGMLARIIDEKVARFQQLQDNAPPVRPLLRHAALGGVTFCELTDFAGLAEEGERMKHCVLGYFERMIEGAVRIVSIRGDSVQTSLTLELQADRRGLWGQAQLRGLCNRPATMQEKALAERWIAAANILTLGQRMFGLRLGTATCVRISERLPGHLRRKLIGTPFGQGRSVRQALKRLAYRAVERKVARLKAALIARCVKRVGMIDACLPGDDYADASKLHRWLITQPLIKVAVVTARLQRAGAGLRGKRCDEPAVWDAVDDQSLRDFSDSLPF